MKEVFHPIWIPFFIFWGLVVLVMISIFKAAGQTDRIHEAALTFGSWSASAIELYIAKVDAWIEEGIADQTDLEFQSGAKLELSRRQEKERISEVNVTSDTASAHPRGIQM